MQQTLIAQPHLTGDVTGEHPELIHGKTGGNEKGSREGRSGSLFRVLGVHFGPCRSLCVVEKVCCYYTFKLHSEHVQGWGAGSGSMPYFKSGAPGRVEAVRQLSQFPVLQPGRAWLGLLRPNRGAGFRPQRITFRSSPHPSPEAYKRGSVELLESRLSASLSVSLFF